MAKIKVLRTLNQQSQPMSLRTIASLGQLPVFSAQRALLQLRKEAWVTKKRSKNRILFSLNTKHEAYELVHTIFHLETDLKLRTRAARYADKAKSALDFANSANTFFNQTPWN